MKAKLLKVFGAIVLGILVVFGCIFVVAILKFKSHVVMEFNPPKIDIEQEIKVADVNLGKRIVTIRNGCTDCHGLDLAGKQVVDDPGIGTMYSSNLTPANLKDWTDEEIARAIRFGVGKNQRSLMFMPSFEFAELSKGDLAATVAFLRTLPPVESHLPQSEAGPVAKVLSMFGKMPILFPALVSQMDLDFKVKPPEGPTLEFGQYLANSACVGCHGKEFRGGPIPGAPPEWLPAANIRLGDRREWTAESFKKALRDGYSPTRSAEIRFPMPIALTKNMTDEEIKALWIYFSTLTPGLD